ncbi:MAG: hypothetical protein ABIP56_03005 [Dokdonella sp.]
MFYPVLVGMRLRTVGVGVGVGSGDQRRTGKERGVHGDLAVN